MKIKELLEKKEKEDENLKKIVDFLKEHSEEAFTVEEISKSLSLECVEERIYNDKYEHLGGKEILKHNNIKKVRMLVHEEDWCDWIEYFRYKPLEKPKKKRKKFWKQEVDKNENRHR